jgi:hypothetical protein
MPTILVTARDDEGNTTLSLFNSENYEFVAQHPQDANRRRIFFTRGASLDVIDAVEELSAKLATAKDK